MPIKPTQSHGLESLGELNEKRSRGEKKQKERRTAEEEIAIPIEKCPTNHPRPAQPRPLLPNKIVSNLPFLHKDRHRLPRRLAAAVTPKLPGNEALHARGNAGVDAALDERGVLGAEEADDSVLACEGGDELGGGVIGGYGVDGDVGMEGGWG